MPHIIFHLLIQHQLSVTFWWQLGVEFSGVDCEIPNYTKFSDIRFNCDVFKQQYNDRKLLKSEIQNTHNFVFTVFLQLRLLKVIRVDVTQTQRTHSLQMLSCCHVVMVLNMTRGTLQVWEKKRKLTFWPKTIEKYDFVLLGHKFGTDYSGGGVDHMKKK